MYRDYVKQFWFLQKHRVAFGLTLNGNKNNKEFVEETYNFLQSREEKALQEAIKLVPKGMTWQWLLSVKGLGESFAVQVLAAFDIEKASTASSFWRYGGLDPTEQTKFNRQAKAVVYKIMGGFIKTKGFYRNLYDQFKELEIKKNNSGGYKEQAEQIIKSYKVKSNKLLQRLQDGKLPDSIIDLRARRRTIKVFLAHLFEVWYWEYHTVKPPEVYVLSHMGHVDKIKPPNFNSDTGVFQDLKEG